MSGHRSRKPAPPHGRGSLYAGPWAVQTAAQDLGPMAFRVGLGGRNTEESVFWVLIP